MERVTDTMLANCSKWINLALQAKGSTAVLVCQGRNGHTALDLYDRDGRCLRTLAVGTRREILSHLHAIRTGMDLLDTPHTETPADAAA